MNMVIWAPSIHPLSMTALTLGDEVHPVFFFKGVTNRDEQYGNAISGNSFVEIYNTNE